MKTARDEATASTVETVTFCRPSPGQCSSNHLAGGLEPFLLEAFATLWLLGVAPVRGQTFPFTFWAGFTAPAPQLRMSAAHREANSGTTHASWAIIVLERPVWPPASSCFSGFRL